MNHTGRFPVIDAFPYLVHYYVEEERKRVIVLGIIHTSRDPRTGRNVYHSKEDEWYHRRKLGWDGLSR